MDEYLLGTPLPNLDPSLLLNAQARELFLACVRHADFTVRELRRLTYKDGAMADGIVVDCDNRQVPARNPYGIRPNEPLLFIVWPSGSRYEVRALRQDFPILVHQNAIFEGEPASLCLYEQSQDEVARTWTPERYLARTLWWLGQSALGTLHAVDQHLEGLFYEGSTSLVLPHDFDTWLASTQTLRFVQTETGAKGRSTLRPIRPSDPRQAALSPLLICLPPVNHRPLSRSPSDLGGLADFFAFSSADFVKLLKEAVSTQFPGGHEIRMPCEAATFLLLRVPRLRTEEGEVECVDMVAVSVNASTVQLGLDLGVLVLSPDGKVFVDFKIGDAPPDEVTATEQLAWRKHSILLMHPRYTATPKDARFYSGIPSAGAEFQGILAGAGALGSALLNMWVREGWGRWAVVDDDSLMPHNLARHIGFDAQIGENKATICAHLANMIYEHDEAVVALPGKINDPSTIRDALNNSDLVVDATTSLGAARDLSIGTHKGRAVSVFLTPSGRSSVLLMEDKARQTQLFNLEGQYYRALLRATWGEDHLTTSDGRRTGNGCRDVSFVLSNEAIQLHAALLARQVRLDSATAEANIRVYTENDDGGVDAIHVPAAKARSLTCGSWTIGWDTQLEEEWFAERKGNLPAETGGILLGISDTASKTIQVVDFQRASIDSKGTKTSFLRGTIGVADALAKVKALTGQQVDYVGEWHTHPDGTAVRPSQDDIVQLAALTARLSTAGLPALQAIIGRSSTSGKPDVAWSLGRCADDGGD